MREEVISSGGTVDPLVVARSSSPPPTPAASSVGASSAAIPTNAGSIDWLGQGQGSKVGSHLPRTSLSTSAGGSALGSSHTSCRPWERGDLLRRLATFKPSNWSGKPKAASSLACARRGWMNVDNDKIVCETCGKQLTFTSLASSTPAEGDNAGEAFAKELDSGHKVTCPWRGNSCAESLVQFPPTPPSALIGGYKDRCDGLLQFQSLPVVALSAIEQMKLSRSPQIDRILSQSRAAGESVYRADNIPGLESSREDALFTYSNAQKLISLCGWEPRWALDVQDCEEHSAQSARNACSFSPIPDQLFPSQDPGPGKKEFTAVNKENGKKKMSIPESRCDSRSPLLDCSLCGVSIRIWDFLTVPRPARLAPNAIDAVETSKKLALTRGVSAASGINGWFSVDETEKEQAECRDEVATTDEGKTLSNAGVDLNLTMAGGLSSGQFIAPVTSEHFEAAAMGRDLIIGQPSGSEVGDRAASFESRGPSTRKRSFEEGGSTVDRPHARVQRADSVEGTVIDRDGDEVNDSREYSGGASKRSRDSDIFYSYHSAPRIDSSGAGPSRSMGFEKDAYSNKIESLRQGNDLTPGATSTRDSARASSVIAMDTIDHSVDSMESVENYPGDVDDIHFPSPSVHKNLDLNDASELHYSNQAQQSACLQSAAGRAAGEMGVSSTTDGGETLHAETGSGQARDGISFGISGGSIGMGASHEAEIHGVDVSIHRADSVVGDVEPIAEVTENVGQTGESAPDPGVMDEFVPEEMDREDRHGDSQEMMSRSVGRADSGSKIDGSTKAESIESGEKMGHALDHDNSDHPSLSCNAMIYSAHEASKEEVTQVGKASLPDVPMLLESDYVAANGMANGESNYGEAVEFDPIKQHSHFCPWVNGNVAAAGSSSSGSSSSTADIAVCGWQLTVDALDTYVLGRIPVQMLESESAASLYKDDHLTPRQKILARRSASKSHGKH